MMSTLEAPIRLGAVSYLNTLPLIEGLGKLADVSLTLTAPSRLIDLLMEREVEIALASIIDAQRSVDPVAIIPVGMIGSGGATLTVRCFSKVPIQMVTRVHADADSHTSVALLRIILAERFGIRPEIVGFDADSDAFHADTDPAASAKESRETVLLIGDKVVANPSLEKAYPHQLDLGQAWLELTGLPFVYAAWMCRADDASSPRTAVAADILDRARRHNATRLEWIAATRGPSRSWPAAIALRYLSGVLQYEMTPAHAASIERFFDLAAEHGVIGRRRPTRWIDVDSSPPVSDCASPCPASHASDSAP